MTDLAVGSADIALDADKNEASRIGEYLASHGGPFFELQRRLGVLGRTRCSPAEERRCSSRSPGAFRSF